MENTHHRQPDSRDAQTGPARILGREREGPGSFYIPPSTNIHSHPKAAFYASFADPARAQSSCWCPLRSQNLNFTGLRFTPRR